MIVIIHKSSSNVVALIEMDIYPEEESNYTIIANWCRSQGLGRDSYYHFRVDDCPVTPYRELLKYSEPIQEE